MKRFPKTIFFISLALTIQSIFLLSYVNAQTFKLSEYEIKAAFIYNFAKFVEWPGESFHDDQTPINICIFGHNPFGDAFQSIRGKKAQGRNIVVTRVNSLQALKKCNILYIGSSSEGQIQKIVKLATASHVLTVSDSERNRGYGVIINFYVADNRIKFTINTDSAKRSGIRISSLLLDVARKFREERD